MTAVTETFIELFKRQPSEADKIRLMSVQKALRLPDDDPLWTILIALDYYQKLYEEAPAKILEATEAAAQSTITAAEASTTEKLIEGALSIAHQRMGRIRSFQWPWVIMNALLSIALIVLGVSFWFATQQFQLYESNLAGAYEKKFTAAQEQFNKTYHEKIKEIESATADQLAQEKSILDWAKQYQDLYKNKDFQSRVDFVAKNALFVDAVKSLNIGQRDNLIQIINKADRWRTIRASTTQPWPCFAMLKPSSVNREVTICQVGWEGEINISRPSPPSPSQRPPSLR